MKWSPDKSSTHLSLFFQIDAYLGKTALELYINIDFEITLRLESCVAAAVYFFLNVS